jgi:hypothetical protein
MSKISYCSLEEAWGNSINKNQDIDNKNTEKKEKPKDYDEEVNSYKSKSQMDYEYLKEDNEKMKKILNTMNFVERNKTPENNINDEYNKYRFNSVNKVNGLYQDSNNYKPFENDLEKKSLQDRFVELENEFRKYRMMMNTRNDNNEEESIESFSNIEGNNTDIQDLIVLIVLGLIIIFIMDNIFKLGKYMGSKK